MSKKLCTITSVEFAINAKPLSVTVAGTVVDVTVKHGDNAFSSGSFGWYANGRCVNPIATRTDWAKAGPLTVVINGQSMIATPKEASEGKSLGWLVNGKINVDVAGKSIQVQVGGNLTVCKSKEGGETLDPRVQVGMNLTVVGSKELAKDATPAPAVEPVAQPVAAESVEPQTVSSLSKLIDW